MKIPVILNDEKTILDADPEEKLMETLRNLKLNSVKEGCQKGKCGVCTVLLDGNPVPSCLIPVGILKNTKIVTLEHFLKTKDGIDIQKGFNEAGIKLCGFCNAARYFAAYTVINKNHRFTEPELQEVADRIHCNCTDSKTYINGILYATANRHSRGGRKNGSK